MSEQRAAANGLRANISTSREEHLRRCNYSGHGAVETWARPGDVRRCQHGRVQIAYEVPGSVPAYWRDLSPVWNPVLYRRAAKALSRPIPPAETTGSEDPA